MRVELATEVFTRPDPEPSEITAVLRLLATFDEGRHDWVIDTLAADDVADYLPRHHPTLADTYAAMARMAAVRSDAWTGTSQADTVVVVSRADLLDHADDLCRAAVVVVENLPNDRYFLTTVIHVFGPEKLREAVHRNWLEFRHSGGADPVPVVAEQEAANFRRVIRVVALFDSDSYTADQVSRHRDKARRLLDQQIDAHILLRREAENYVPDRVLREIGHHGRAADKVALLNRMLPHQRGYIDIKNGLSGPVKPEQATMVASLDQDIREGFGGFGGGVLKQMYELRHRLTEAAFVAMDAEAADDLRKLLALINSKV
jgi:hypothetical protein